jgi:hypothetical protein
MVEFGNDDKRTNAAERERASFDRGRREGIEQAAQLVEQFTRFDHTTVLLVRPNIHAVTGGRTEYLTSRIAREIRALTQQQPSGQED